MNLSIGLTINGERRDIVLDDPRVTLLDLLRERLQLTGTKKGCDRGQCGACTVLVDGKRINSCLALAVSHDGAEILTIEGVAQGDHLHPVQAAFIAHDGLQCGFCTPGQIMSAIGLINEGAGRRRSRAHPRRHERQSLPLRRLCGDHRGGAGRPENACQHQDGARGMNEFDYVRPASRRRGGCSRRHARRRLSRRRHQSARPDEGRRSSAPRRLVDVTRLPGLDRIEKLADGSLRIGAMVRNADLAHDAEFAKNYPAIAEALLSGASAQLRNAATVGGNLLQRTRCGYFYDTASPLQQARARLGLRCSRRRQPPACDPGLERRLHRHASFRFLRAARGASTPSVEIEGRNGRREIALEALHRLPGATPERDSVLEPGELIVAVRLPASARAFAAHSRYLKVRERTSYAFAIVSAAAGLVIERGTIREARLALGGVAAKAVARAGGGSAACGIGRWPRRVSAARRKPHSPRQSRPATTPSRSSSRSASSCAR